MSDLLKRLLAWVLDRLTEQSTFKGIIWALTAAGIALKPNQIVAITATGTALVSLIEILRNEKGSIQKQIDVSDQVKLTSKLNETPPKP